MKVLVLGGSRFIGRAIVEHVLRAGHDVTLLNRGRSRDPFATRVRRVLGDRHDPSTLKRALAKQDFDAVIDVTAYRAEDTRMVVQACRDRIAHLVHISSAAVYLIRDGLYPPYHEDHAVGPERPEAIVGDPAWRYAHHKRRCESVLGQAWEEHRFPATSLRLPLVVGEHDVTRRSDAYLERIAAGGPLILPEGGLNSWGFLWVEDLARTVAANLANSISFGRAYNLMQREIVSLRQFVELAAGCLGHGVQVLSLPASWLHRVGIGTGFSPYSHDHDVVLDCAAARDDLLFEPTPTPRWVEVLAESFRKRWDGVVSSFAHTRAAELALVREVSRIRLPVLASPRAASG